MKAVIMAGGKGTRLKEINNEIPKPMFEILNKPILEYQIESLKKSGIFDIFMIVGYLGDIIINHFKDGKDYGVNIEYIKEEQPLGTAGALYYLKDIINDDFVLTFGDLIFDVDFNKFMSFHKEKGGLITLFTHPNSHPYDSDVIVPDSNNKVNRICYKKEERNFYYKNIVNSGLYCISNKLLNEFEKPEKRDLEKDVIFNQINKGNVYSYKSSEYVKDMGTPDRLFDVEKDIKNNIVYDKSQQNKQKAIFLDRDGTINEYVGLLRNIKDFKLIDGVSEAISKINKSSYLVIVITNQPVVARGEVTIDELNNIHNKMETLLGNDGAYLDDVLYCPHHPDSGYEGEIKEYKVKCRCRKPNIGLLEEAVSKYNIDLSKSWMIGDTTTDIQTGINAKTKTVLLKTGVGGSDGKYNVKPTYNANTLEAAVNLILNETYYEKSSTE